MDVYARTVIEEVKQQLQNLENAVDAADFAEAVISAFQMEELATDLRL